MLSINVSHAKPFLSYPYEEVLCPRLERAQRELLNGGGKGDDFIGWVRLPAQYDRAEYARILAAAKKIQGDSKALVVIGIGGSYLGARGVIECLCSPNYNLKKKDTPNVYFIGNGLSSAALREVMELIGDDDFSVNVISKSGTTTEPAVAFRFFRERLEQKYGKAGAAQRIYATTDAHKGALKSLADAEGYEEFVVPDNVGGRYSVLTAVGLLPIAVAGVDTDALLAGAREMEALCEIADYTNPAWQYAAMRHELYRSGKKIELLACFEPSFRFMAEWWKQLYGESEGKDGKGIFPASVNNTADLHSMGQFIQEGSRVMFETLINVENANRSVVIGSDDQNLDKLNYLAGQHVDHCNAMAQLGVKVAHIDGGVPQLEVSMERIDEYNLGSIFYFFEFACGISAYVLGVNPFNQPGVEAYKKNMFALLRKPGFEAETEAILKRI